MNREELEGKLIRTGIICGYCRRPTAEEWIRPNGMYYYRCQKCVDEANPNDSNPCPKCGCKAHQFICNSGELTDEGLRKLEKDCRNPFRPEFESFECLNCGNKWFTQEYEKYLLNRAIQEVKVVK